MEEVVKKGDFGGVIKEQLARKVFERNGLVHYESKYTHKPDGSNVVEPDSKHGLDLVFEDPESGYIVVVESKPFNNGAFNLAKGSNSLSPQMSTEYILEQADRMLMTGEANIMATAEKIIAADRSGTLRKVVAGVDTPAQNFVMVPLE